MRSKIDSVLDWHHNNLRRGAGASFIHFSLTGLFFTSKSNILLLIYTFIFHCFDTAFYVLNSTLAPALGLSLNPKEAARSEEILTMSLSKIESFWLDGRGKFLVGNFQPSNADLSLVCELMQLQVCSFTHKYIHNLVILQNQML